MLTEDAALQIVQAVHDSNGAEALRLMYRRYNPPDAAETAGKVERSIAGGFGYKTKGRTWITLFSGTRGFMSSKECQEKRCRTSSGEPSITDHRMPPGTHLLVNAQTLTEYATVRAAIEAFLAVNWKWGTRSDWSSDDGS